jgi:hypothetical protein
MSASPPVPLASQGCDHRGSPHKLSYPYYEWLGRSVTYQRFHAIPIKPFLFPPLLLATSRGVGRRAPAWRRYSRARRPGDLCGAWVSSVRAAYCQACPMSDSPPPRSTYSSGALGGVRRRTRHRRNQLATPRQYSIFIPSRDRALQLEGTLSSLKRHCRDLDGSNVSVLVSATSDAHLMGYRRVASEHPDVRFWIERRFDRDARKLLHCPARSRYPTRLRQRSRTCGFQLMIVDDTLFVDRFSLQDVSSVLAGAPHALGVSLRLGESIEYCQPLGIQSLPPPLHHLSGEGRDELVSFRWVDSQPDWGYPLELSSSLYRRDELMNLVQTVSFDSPTTLEHGLWLKAPIVAESRPSLISYRRPRAFSLALNRVQAIAANPVSGHDRHRPVELLARLYEGWRIDVGAYEGFLPHACHQEVELLLARHPEHSR